MTVYVGTIFFIDGFNRKTERTYKVDALDFATAESNLADLAEALTDITKLGIVKTRVYRDVNFATAIVAGANKDAGLTATWELSPLGSGKLATTTIPGPLESVFDANGNLILADTDVQTWASIMLNGTILISDGELAVLLTKGVLDR